MMNRRFGTLQPARRHASIQPAGEVDKPALRTPQSDQSSRRCSHLPLSAYLRIGAVDRQQALVDEAMESGVGQRADTQVGLPVEMGEAGHHLALVTVVGAEVQVAGAAVLLLVDEVVQQDV